MSALSFVCVCHDRVSLVSVGGHTMPLCWLTLETCTRSQVWAALTQGRAAETIPLQYKLVMAPDAIFPPRKKKVRCVCACTCLCIPTLLTSVRNSTHERATHVHHATYGASLRSASLTPALAHNRMRRQKHRRRASRMRTRCFRASSKSTGLTR